MTSTNGAAPIRTEALTKHYKDVKALVDLDLEVDQGEVFGFLGPNGAGKTTTIRNLLHFIFPTSGSASVLGHGGGDPGSRDPQPRRLHAVGILDVSEADRC